MRKIDLIVVHCAATKANMDIDKEWIRKIHVDQNGWSDIGYHFFIKRDGTVEECRPIERSGAHAKEYNKNSIGVCYAGGIDNNGQPEDNRTEEQKTALLNLINELCLKYPVESIIGHCNISSKACPSFDAKSEYNGLTHC